MKKIDENDPRLAAYAFGELSRREAEEVERALRDRPDLRAIVDDFVLMGGMLAEGFGGDAGLKLRPEQRSAVHRAGRRPAAGDVATMSGSGWVRPVAVVFGVAAAVALCFVVLNEVKVERPLDGGDVVEVDLSETSGEPSTSRLSPGDADEARSGDAAMVASGSEEAKAQDMKDEMVQRAKISAREPAGAVVGWERDWSSPDDRASVRVPLVCGDSSWKWVRQSIVEEKRLPESDRVRVEELVNHFDYGFDRSAERGVISVYGEVVVCPWDADRHLGVVSVRHRGGQLEPLVEAGITFTDSVKSYRLVGYAGEGAGSIGPGSVKMRDGDGQVVLYELKLADNVGEGEPVFLFRTMANDGEDSVKETLPVAMGGRRDGEIGADLEKVLLVATWGRWLETGDEELKEKVVAILKSVRADGDELVGELGVIEASLEL